MRRRLGAVLVVLVVAAASVLMSHASARPEEEGARRVAAAERLLKAGTVYAKGCSGFVCDVLAIDWESADLLMGDAPQSIGKNPKYDLSKLKPGDIVGWKAAVKSPAHVAVYIGSAETLFIDVPGEKKAPRAVKRGYELTDEVFKSSRF